MNGRIDTASGVCCQTTCGQQCPRSGWGELLRGPPARQAYQGPAFRPTLRRRVRVGSRVPTRPRAPRGQGPRRQDSCRREGSGRFQAVCAPGIPCDKTARFRPQEARSSPPPNPGTLPPCPPPPLPGVQVRGCRTAWALRLGEAPGRRLWGALCATCPRLSPGGGRFPPPCSPRATAGLLTPAAASPDPGPCRHGYPEGICPLPASQGCHSFEPTTPCGRGAWGSPPAPPPPLQ